jgi:aryl-alcohol dehydrogenase-like predicted oxidoreductase
MKTTPFHEYQLSQLMLGTVQFGESYGIANKTGQPSYKKVCEILEYAAENGVNCLDTAYAYGQSEEVLGRALCELHLADKMVVVSKVPLLAENLKPDEAERLIEKAVQISLKRLQMDFLPIYLFHNENNSDYADSLLKIKEKGLARHIGISVNSPEMARRAVDCENYEAVQIPTSILDQRYIKSGVMLKTAKRGLALFVRSVYLQGLLFLPENELPEQLKPVISVRRVLEQTARKEKMSLAELAARFVMSLDGVHCLVMGMETLEQLKENIALFDEGPLEVQLRDEILESVLVLPDEVIVPALWPKATVAKPFKA